MHFEKVSIVTATAGEVYEWHTRPGALERLTPPWQTMRTVGGVAEICSGSRVNLRLGRGSLAVTWIAEHTSVEPGKGFEDVQVKGPFRSWRHRHQFVPVNGDRCELRDSIDYEIPAGILGRGLAGAFVERSIGRTFDYRHQTTREDLAFHRRYAAGDRMRVGITGAAGLIGTTLSSLLTTGGHQVVRLVRSSDAAESSSRALWDPSRGILEPGKVEGLDAVVHLAGENISRGRWTQRQKGRIRSSRIEGTTNLVEALGALERPPRIFVSASAIGYYGDREGEILTEASAPGQGFLAGVCEGWERAATGASDWASRVVRARFGVVLSPRGGALAKMLPAFRWGGGGKIGTGDQLMSWISIDDVAGALTHVLQTPELDGPVNLVSPEPVSNREFTRDLARVLKRPAAAAMPELVARAVFGQMAEEILLAGSRVQPERLLSSGYSFRHRRLSSALSYLLGR